MKQVEAPHDLNPRRFSHYRAEETIAASLSHRLAIVVTLAVVPVGCAVKGSSRWERPLDRSAVSSAGAVFVMEPTIGVSALRGNVGRNVVEIRTTVAARILAIVRERFPAAQIADIRPLFGGSMAEAYAAAAGGRATHLLVPTIVEWREMRTDDPIGAIILPHNRIVITLRLMRLEPPTLVGEITFSNGARLTLNQRPFSLLNDRFRRMVLQLVSGASARTRSSP